MIDSMWSRRLLAIVAIACSAPSSAAEAPAFDLATLEAPTGLEAIDDIAEGSRAAQFVPASADRIPGPTGPGQWLRITLREGGSRAEPLVFVLREARSSRVTLVPPRGGRPASQTITGEEPSPRFARDALYFALTASPRAGDVYYLHVGPPSGSASMAMTLGLVEMAEVNASNLRRVRHLTAVTGSLVVLGITALLISLGLRDRAFAYYGAGALNAGLYLAFFYGDGYAWVSFPSDEVMGFNAIAIPGLLGSGFNMLLFRELLDLSRYSQRTSTILKGLAILTFVLSAVLLAAGGGMQRALVGIANLVILAGSLVMLPSLVALGARGSRAAHFLFGAWISMNVFVVWRVASVLRGDPSTPEQYYGFLVAMLLAEVLMACGLADRIRHRRSALVQARTSRGAAYTSREHGAIVVKLGEACAHGRSMGLPTSVLKVQLDHASRIAAQQGVPVVDACMTFLLARIRHALRDSDAVGRVGDGELLVVLPGTSAATATAIAERIRLQASANALHSQGMSLAATVSVGLAWTQEAGTAQPEALLAQAEAAAATADNAGGDQVVALPA